jgi:hypothetical protein
MDLSSPIVRARRGEELLSLGQYAEGFRLYDAWRDAYPDKWHNLPIPRWDGGPLKGQRLVITGEQGFGDQIMFARFAKLAQAEGASVVWLCEPPLERLFNQCLGVRAVSKGAGYDVGGVSCYCPSSALPNMFFPPLTEPPSAPYMDTPPANSIRGLTVGVISSGNPNHVNDAARSLPPQISAELMTLAGAVDLQPEITGARDFYDTATVIAGLDLVITVDTATAHLAGAMGKPVWILLPYTADWRWLRDREDSPWYPSARLFRQASPGDWAGVVERVRSALVDAH